MSLEGINIEASTAVSIDIGARKYNVRLKALKLELNVHSRLQEELKVNSVESAIEAIATMIEA